MRDDFENMSEDNKKIFYDMREIFFNGKKDPRTYSEKLKDPQWQKKRLQILERDGFKCRMCSSSVKTLHVHHFAYSDMGYPWMVPDNCLITFCEDCHKDEESYKRQTDYHVIRGLGFMGHSNYEMDRLGNLLNSMAWNEEITPNELYMMLLEKHDPKYHADLLAGNV